MGNSINKIEKFTEELHTKAALFMDAKFNYDYAMYFLNPSGVKEKDFFNRSSEIRLILNSVMKISIINLHKLITESSKIHTAEKSSLLYLLSHLKKDGQYGDLITNHQKISDFIKEFEEKDELIKKIKFIRDTAYAHTDLTKPNTYFHTDEIKLMLDLIEKVITELYKDILKVNFAYKELHKELDVKDCKIMEILADNMHLQKNVFR